MSLEAFPPQARLRKKADFDRLLRRGGTAERIKRASGPVSLLGAANEAGYARLGLVVPKRWIRRAVDRNRIKRVLREQFRRQRRHLRAMDVIIMVQGRMSEDEMTDLNWRAAKLLEAVR